MTSRSETFPRSWWNRAVGGVVPWVRFEHDSTWISMKRKEHVWSVAITWLRTTLKIKVGR